MNEEIEKAPEDITIEDLAMGERKFLHDISNQLVIAQGMSSFLVTALHKNESVSEKEKSRIEKVQKAVKEMINMVQSRRSLLHSLSEDKK